MDGAHLLTLCRFLLEYMVLDIKRPELCPYPFKLYSATDLIGTDRQMFGKQRSHAGHGETEQARE
jgi:hypothetical protein